MVMLQLVNYILLARLLFLRINCLYSTEFSARFRAFVLYGPSDGITQCMSRMQRKIRIP